MQTLASVIQQLEAQQDRLIGANATLKQELENERQAHLDSVSKADEVRERLRQSEHELADRENLMAELGHVSRERDRLTVELEGLEKKMADRAGERQDRAALIARLQATREDLVAEVGSVEAQFERAMSMVSQLRARLAAVQEEMDSLHQQLRDAHERLDMMDDERGALLHEVDQSRAALDEIRRSLADACLTSGAGAESIPSRS